MDEEKYALVEVYLGTGKDPTLDLVILRLVEKLMELEEKVKEHG